MNHGQPISQTKEIEMRMAVMERMALIVGALLFCLVMDQTKAHPDSRETGERPVLLLANESLPPMNFMKHGRPSGIVIDLAEALSKHMHRPVEIRLMDWAEAQQLVLDGRADALLQINPSPERMKFYDFSDPLLTTEFTIFTSVNRLGVTSMHDLRGLKVGVEKQGLPVSLVREDPEIIVEIIPDLIQGFRMLSAGTVDAVIADRWVGAYIVAENDIRGVKLIEHPVSRSQSAIAVKKGGRDLLGDINTALADIRGDGTYDRIINSWRSKEVVFKTREQLRQENLLFAVIFVALLVALVGSVILAREIRRRRRIETVLRGNEERLRLFIEHAPASIAMFDRDMRYLSVSRRWRIDYGLGDRDLIGRSHYDIFPEIPDSWKKVHSRGMAGEVVRAEEDRFHRADGSVQWLRWEVRPWRDSTVATGGIVIFTEDITSRKQAEAALEKMRFILSEGQKIAHLGTFEYVPETRTTIWSEEEYRIYGLDPAGSSPAYDVMLKKCIHPDDAVLLHQTFTAAMESGAIYELEHRIVRPDGSVRWVYDRAHPYFDETGRLLRYIGATLDITARRQAEEALQKAKGELEIRVQERTGELAKSQERLQHLASQLLLAQEKERKRVALDLHDGLLSELAAMKMLFDGKMSLLEQGKLSDLSGFKKVADILALVMREARGIMNNLHPSVLDELGLIAAVNWLTGEYEKSYPHIKVQKRLEVSEQDIEESVRVVIFRVLQEALNNFAKHGKGDRVELSLAKANGTFAFALQDNGQGFDVENTQKGLGLDSMRERVELSGGKFQIESIIGQGTTIRAIWST